MPSQGLGLGLSYDAYVSATSEAVADIRTDNLPPAPMEHARPELEGETSLTGDSDLPVLVAEISNGQHPLVQLKPAIQASHDEDQGQFRCMTMELSGALCRVKAV